MSAYTLHIGDKPYSSWSLRGHLLLAAFDLPFAERLHRMDDPAFDAFRTACAPARTVPALEWVEAGARLLVWDSLAIAETLAERHPEARLWPEPPAARAAARAVSAEMHSGFAALRREAPMNTRRQGPARRLSPEGAGDLARIEALWAHAMVQPRDGAGPFLFGRFTAADAFFAPIAWRITGYRLPVGPAAAAYVAALLAHPAMVTWTEAAARDPRRLAKYEAI